MQFLLARLISSLQFLFSFELISELIFQKVATEIDVFVNFSSDIYLFFIFFF